MFITHKDLDRADIWFAKYGEPAVFFSRLLPVIRTFISFPAGVVGMDLKRFTILTFIGSMIWSTALAWLGYVFGANYEEIRQVMRPFDIPIILIILALVIFYIYRKVREMRAEARRMQVQKRRNRQQTQGSEDTKPRLVSLRIGRQETATKEALMRAVVFTGPEQMER